MKSYYILFIIVLFFQPGCNKDNTEGPHPEWTKVTALKDGQYWETNAVALMKNNGEKKLLSIPANVHNEYGFWRESLSFDNVDLLIGKQVITSSQTDSLYASYITLMADGDVVEDRFVLLQNESSYFGIQYLDINKMEMDGVFQVTFVRDENDPVTNPNLPDTIRFTEGEFHLKIVDKD